MVDQNRKEIERRLDQARRMAAASPDRTTMERLTELIDELEGELRAERKKSKVTSMGGTRFTIPSNTASTGR
jgi:hypothetical protein